MVLEHIPSPKIAGSTQMLVTSLDYSFTGRIAIGRLQRGNLRVSAYSLVKGMVAL